MKSVVYNITTLPYHANQSLLPSPHLYTSPKNVHTCICLIDDYSIITNLYIFDYELVMNSDVQFDFTRVYNHVSLLIILHVITLSINKQLFLFKCDITHTIYVQYIVNITKSTNTR